jgi:HlyD family secretion protein
LQLDREKLRQFEPYVKSGLPGMGYVRYDNNAEWPKSLQVKPLSEIPWLTTGAPAPK